MFSEVTASILRINLVTGIVFWFSYEGKYSEHTVRKCVQMPEIPNVKNYDQIKHIRSRLILSNYKEEPVSYGYIREVFSLSGSEDKINAIYVMEGCSFVRIIEKGDGRFHVESWGQMSRDSQIFRGDGLTGTIKEDGEILNLYRGAEIVQEFGPLGSAVFLNEAASRVRSNPQKTLNAIVH